MTPAATFLLWGAMLAILATVAVAIFGTFDVEVAPLLYGAAGIMAVLAGFLTATRFGSSDPRTALALPDVSPPTAWLGASLVLLALSSELGLWLALIAGGMAGFGVGGLLREGRAQRKAYRRMLVEHGPTSPGPGGSEP